MKKLGLIFDSFICESKKDVEKKGYGYLPLRCDIDGKIYDSGVDLTSEELLDQIAQAKEVKTSLARLDQMEEVIDNMTKKYDDVLYLGIGECLSSSLTTAATYCKQYKNFHVLNNGWVGDQYNVAAEYAQRIYQKTQNIKDVIEKLQEVMKKSIVYVLPLKLDYAIKGGRVSGFKRFMLKTFSKIKLFPYIKYYDNKNVTGGLARGKKGALRQIINKMANFANLPIEKLNDDYYIHFIKGNDDQFATEVKEVCKDNKLQITSTKFNQPVIAIHTGPEAISLSLIPKLDKWEV